MQFMVAFFADSGFRAPLPLAEIKESSSSASSSITSSPTPNGNTAITSIETAPIDADFAEIMGTLKEDGQNLRTFRFDGSHYSPNDMSVVMMEQHGQRLYDMVATTIDNTNTPVTVVLLAKGRGCLSAFHFLNLLAAHPNRNNLDKVTVGGDFIDPMTGENAVKANLPTNRSLAHRFHDLQHVRNLKTVQISLSLQGPTALIPQFSDHTKVQVSPLPGHALPQKKSVTNTLKDTSNVINQLKTKLFLIGTVSPSYLTLQSGATLDQEIRANYNLLLNLIASQTAEAKKSLKKMTRSLYKDGEYRVNPHASSINLHHAHINDTQRDAEDDFKYIRALAHPMLAYHGARRDLQYSCIVDYDMFRWERLVKEPKELANVIANLGELYFNAKKEQETKASEYGITSQPAYNIPTHNNHFDLYYTLLFAQTLPADTRQYIVECILGRNLGDSNLTDFYHQQLLMRLRNASPTLGEGHAFTITHDCQCEFRHYQLERAREEREKPETNLGKFFKPGYKHAGNKNMIADIVLLTLQNPTSQSLDSLGNSGKKTLEDSRLGKLYKKYKNLGVDVLAILGEQSRLKAGSIASSLSSSEMTRPRSGGVSSNQS